MEVLQAIDAKITTSHSSFLARSFFIQQQDGFYVVSNSEPNPFQLELDFLHFAMEQCTSNQHNLEVGLSSKYSEELEVAASAAVKNQLLSILDMVFFEGDVIEAHLVGEKNVHFLSHYTSNVSLNLTLKHKDSTLLAVRDKIST